MNSWLALLLARALRYFSTKDDAREYFSSAKLAARNFLRELVALIDKTPHLRAYVHQPESQKHLAYTEVDVPHRLETNAEYLFEEHDLCFPSPAEEPDLITVGLTGAQRDRDHALEFAKNEEFRKATGEGMLEAAVNGLTKTNLLQPQSVAELYYPHGEVATQLLLKLEGYSFSDWEK